MPTFLFRSVFTVSSSSTWVLTAFSSMFKYLISVCSVVGAGAVFDFLVLERRSDVVLAGTLVKEKVFEEAGITVVAREVTRVGVTLTEVGELADVTVEVIVGLGGHEAVIATTSNGGITSNGEPVVDIEIS